jgi:hypothetical protein
MSRQYALDGLALEIREPWKKYVPKMDRELEREGRLDQSLHEASEKTGQAFGELVGGGLEPHAAWGRSARSGRSCRRSPIRPSQNPTEDP